MWDCFQFPKPNDKSPTPRTFLLPETDAAPDGNDDDDPRRRQHPPTTTIAMIVTSWARGRRLRYLFLALCSPLILPLLCLAFPFICAVEICFCVCRRHRRHRRRKQVKAIDDDFDSDAIRRCEEGDVREIRLLQRYLDDQLLLVLEVYEPGELDFDDWDNDDGEFFDSCCRN